MNLWVPATFDRSEVSDVSHVLGISSQPSLLTLNMEKLLSALLRPGGGNLISDSSAFSKSSLNIWKFTVHILLKPDLENFEHYLVCEMSAIVL